MDEYLAMYKESVEDPEGFWAKIAEDFYWEKKWDKVRDYNYAMSKGKVFIEWFKNAKTNITYNCLDRHLATRGDQTALIWEGNNVGGYMVYTGTTFKYIFDYHDGDIYWCTADIGWVTGHSYIVYGLRIQQP